MSSMMVRVILVLAAGFGFAASSAAAPLSVRVVDASGRPVRDAVVTLYPTGSAARPPRMGDRFVVAQRNLRFQPFLTIVPVGANVSFPNFDPTKHHVYSFSAAKRFELKLFAKDQSRTVHFDKPGVVALGCNIHDAMSAFIVVTDSAWTARTDAHGIAALANTPNVPGRLALWHPYLRAPGGLVQQAVASSQRSAAFAVRLRPPPAMLMKDY
jgi:plastocyanin